MEFENLTQEQKEELRQHRESTKHQKKDGGISNQHMISGMEAMIEDQSHIITSLSADRDIPPLPPLPPPILQDPYKHLQTPSGFNQRK